MKIEPAAGFGAAGTVESLEAQKKAAVFDSSVDNLVLALQTNPTVMKLASDLEQLAIATCNKLVTPHYAFSVEPCCKHILADKIIRVHAHLWLSLKNQGVYLQDLALPGHPSHLPFCNWKAIQYLAGTGSRSQAAHLSGN